MNKFTQAVKEFWNDEEGLTAVEYAVAGSLIVAGLVAVFGGLGTQIVASINELIEAMGGTAVTVPE